MTPVVWITGAAGFSGQYVARHLRQQPGALHLVGLDCRPCASGAFDQSFELDLNDETAVQHIARRTPPHRVIHLAGLLPPAPEADLWRVNVLGTLNLLRALSDRRSPALRILNVGSAAEYLPHRGRTLRETAPAGGLSPYGRSKWAQGQLALALGRELGLAIVVARTFNLVGPGLSTALVAGALCAQFAQRESRRIQVGNLESQRDFIDIRDAAAAYATLVERGRPGRIYNVCTGRATRIRAVVQCLSRLTGLRPRLQRDPARLKPQDVDRVCGDNSALRSLGWKPKVSLRQSLQDMLDAAQSR